MFLSLRLIVRYFQCFVRGSSPSGKVVFHESPLPLGNNCVWTPLPLGIYNDLPWVGGGVWIFSGTTQLHIKVECQVISKMKPSTTLNLSTKVPHEKSLEWGRASSNPRICFVFHNNAPQSKVVTANNKNKIFSFLTRMSWCRCSSALICTLIQADAYIVSVSSLCCSLSSGLHCKVQRSN